MKPVTLSIIAAGILIGGAFFLSGRSGSLPIANDASNGSPGANVSIVDGKQIVEIRAKGGYTPRKSVARSGLPTIVRFNTAGTFDCSAAIRIPSLGISQILPQNGSTDIDIGTSTSGILRGSCGMGMYPFQIDFQS